MRRIHITEIIPIILALAAITGFFLPWVWHNNAALASGARDLAEWTTLHPGTPPLFPSFFLRAANGLLAVLITLSAIKQSDRVLRYALRALALLVLAGMMPPFEFFSSARGDANYLQQFILLVAAGLLTIGAWSASHWPKSLRHAALIVTAFTGTAFGLVGLAEGLLLLKTFDLGHAVGGGGVLFAAAVLLLGIGAELPLINNKGG